MLPRTLDGRVNFQRLANWGFIALLFVIAAFLACIAILR